jgi:hypothetical protein
MWKLSMGGMEENKKRQQPTGNGFEIGPGHKTTS